MKMLHHTSAELTTKLRDARGNKRRQILAELQRRYDETVVRPDVADDPYTVRRSPRFDYALYHGEPHSALRVPHSALA